MPGISETAPRRLTALEGDLLESLLAHDFPGVEELRSQVRSVMVTPGCTCGCGTISFEPEAAKIRSGRVAPVEGEVLGSDGDPVGGLLLFVTDDGRLDGLEVYSYGEAPLALPTAERVRWHRPDST